MYVNQSLSFFRDDGRARVGNDYQIKGWMATSGEREIWHWLRSSRERWEKQQGKQPIIWKSLVEKRETIRQTNSLLILFHTAWGHWKWLLLTYPPRLVKTRMLALQTFRHETGVKGNITLKLSHRGKGGGVEFRTRYPSYGDQSRQYAAETWITEGMNPFWGKNKRGGNIQSVWN